MARHWKERFDPSRHLDHFVWNDSSRPVQAPSDSLIERWVYFVEVCGFKFEFQSISQLDESLNFFSQKTHPSSQGRDMEQYDHWFHYWHERLPIWLFEEPRRQRLLKALRHAREDFVTGS